MLTSVPRSGANAAGHRRRASARRLGIFRTRPAGAVAAAVLRFFAARRRARRIGAWTPFKLTLLTPLLPRRHLPLQHWPLEIHIGTGNHVGAQHLPQLVGRHFPDLTALQPAKLERPERDADQPVHLEAEMLQHIAYLAVLALASADGEPDIGALLAIERGLDGAIADAVDGDAALEPIERLLRHAAERAHPIAAQPAGLRQLDHARQLAIIGEEQQALGVDVEPADADQ